MLLERLPDGCHTREAMDGIPEGERGWTLDKHLLAGLLDRVGVTNYLLGASLVSSGALGKNGKNPIEEPRPLPRPGVNQPADNGKRGKGMKMLVRALGAPV